ncbi:hypothetical protein J25TS5_47700 [Paenibacillus faecis]|uniref:Uncharacterized protein n=1 Tax=Paenibacillus faecis TaxID=862114 RepID=A0A5D0CKU3_9BACL|nr:MULTISPECIES: hypothetical protein [Paenibacillus]MCA1292660.1 hypothetical protein [Paenibacillus sp. alder61]TYA10468.1 hypothetical protein FRY98_21865 [Paenibacillus faecis]GIO87838.1 hypothetical protein J25TS5_47700 [Paenibacillus faecis]
MKSDRKKYMFLFAAVLLVILALMVIPTLKNSWQMRTLKSTDLTDLSIMNIRPGQTENSVDFSRFKPSPDFEDQTQHGIQYKYFEDFMVVFDSSGTIVKLQTLSDKGLRSFGDGTITDMAQVEKRWGTDFVVRSYNREQGLTARIYEDKQNRLKAEFVYPGNGELDGKLVFLILEKY